MFFFYVEKIVYIRNGRWNIICVSPPPAGSLTIGDENRNRNSHIINYRTDRLSVTSYPDVNARGFCQNVQAWARIYCIDHDKRETADGGLSRRLVSSFKSPTGDRLIEYHQSVGYYKNAKCKKNKKNKNTENQNLTEKVLL